jgi:2-hydroxy-3-keto-5-methylthiopentenyl-1-phosphate phosphatase
LKSQRIAVVSDFDGTITLRDVGHHFFEKFIPDRKSHEDLLEKWKIGLISSRECLEKEIAWVKAGISDLDDFIEDEPLDPFFKDFVDFCNRRKFELMILSDGLDYYIDSILMRYGYGFIDFRSNHLVADGDVISGVEFPWYLPELCDMCANCKKAHIDRLRGEGYFTVYIGNGYSDRCPSEHADMVFAKGDLLDHCEREKIDCIRFRNFRDVEREMMSRLFLSD